MILMAILTLLASFASAVCFVIATVETVKVIPVMAKISVPACSKPILAVQLPESRIERDVGW
jgi:hypothetical protein